VFEKAVPSTLITCACVLAGVLATASGAVAQEPEADAPGAPAASQVFLPTGHPQTYTVPAGVHYLHVEAAGGHGGSGHAGGKGGLGVAVDAHYVRVQPGDQLRILVGGDGGTAVGGGKLPNEGGGGYNGGGDGARGGGGGGGFSSVQRPDGTYAVVAGGGGGGATGANGGPQNPPGTLDGQNGGGSLGTPRGGGGGTLTAGGAGGHNASPLVRDGKGGGRFSGGDGGVGVNPKGSNGGAGGGAGYFGGGGGAGSETGSGGGGGAGSSYVDPDVRIVTTTHAGSGQITITPEPGDGPTRSLTLQAPTTMDAGSPYDLTVTALDATGARVPDYRGTVHFSSSVPGALPQDYAFVAADRGQHVFRAGARFLKAGTVSVTAADIAGPALTATVSGIEVRARALSALAITPKHMIIGRMQPFHVEGYDAFGNDLGDVSAQATVRVQPEAGCTRTPAGIPTCIANYLDAGSDPYHFVSATIGTLGVRQKVAVVTRAPADVTLHADPPQARADRSATFTATVRNPVPDLGPPTGEVAFYDGATKLGSAPLAPAADGATAAWEAHDLTGGERRIAAVYSGDGATTGGRAEIAFRVAPLTTVVHVVSTDNPAAIGTNPGFRAFVTTDAASGSQAVTQGTIIVTADGNARQRFSLAAADPGAVTRFPTALEPGRHAISAYYLGTDAYRSNETSVPQVVLGDGVPTSVAVQASDATADADEPISFSATVTSTGDLKPAGTVSFVVDGTPFGAPAGVVDGKATSAAALISGALGPHTVTASYLPSPGLAASTATLAGGIVVQPSATRTLLTSSAPHSDPGDPVTFTAQVTTRWGSAQGRVRFTIDGQPVGDPYEVIGGRAVVRVGPSFYGSLLSPGTHVVGALFQSYNDRTQGSSADLRQQVGPAVPTTTTLRSSDARSELGQAVSFVATIATADPSDDPSGSVQFAIDGVALGGPVTVVGGRARSIATTRLAVGSHRVTATYSSDAFDFAGSADVLGSQLVVAPRPDPDDPDDEDDGVR
jgi:hypothetical protein